MIDFAVKIKNIILDILFPPLCLNCRKYLPRSESPNNYICDNCFDSIKLNNTLFCPICRLRLADNKKICRHSDKNFSYLLAAAGNYDDPVLRNLIHYFKYKNFENLAPILGEILIKYLENLSLSIVKNQMSIVIPVPLHKSKEKYRGFNQSKLIAEFIADKFNLELIDGLKRIKNTEPQVNLKDNGKRAENIANCFQVRDPESVSGRNILLIDDVFTSGATISEAVKILKENGSRRIIAIVLART